MPRTDIYGYNLQESLTGKVLRVTYGQAQGTESTPSVATLEPGSATEPSLHFTSDTNTGLFRPQDGELAFTSNGTEVVRFTGQGLEITGLLEGSAVVQSPTDSTLGRLLTTGTYGLGREAPTIGNASVIDNSIAPGFYGYDTGAGSSGGPTSVTQGMMVHIRRSTLGGEAQILVANSASGITPGDTFVRTRNTSSWSDWNPPGVSESGSYSTDSVVGRYIKYTDGSAECWGYYDDTGGEYTTASGVLFMRTGVLNFTLPFTFATAPTAVAILQRNNGTPVCGVHLMSVNTTTLNLLPWAASAVAAGSQKYVYMRIVGRWR